MKCAQAENLIPLFVGDDLAPREADALRAHLASCPQCEARAAEFADSRAWLQSLQPPAFDDLRGAVLGAIQAEPPRGGWFDRRRAPRWALLAACLLLLAGAALFMRRGPAPKPAPDLTQVARPEPPLPESRRIDPPRFDPPTPRRAMPRRHPAPAQPSPTPADLATTSDEMLRIEMQTEDPNIRIIWFAPKPGASTNPK
ncbi:MAG: zf-HC2 domain-containing protein [Blastocatellia bacterium]|nr:zf-HC2 domain-containing protein [Blastocatellia bacterium]